MFFYTAGIIFCVSVVSKYINVVKLLNNILAVFIKIHNFDLKCFSSRNVHSIKYKKNYCFCAV